MSADRDDNRKNNHCFYHVEPQRSLRESQNDIRFRHDFTR
jgi:hypothetical protein